MSSENYGATPAQWEHFSKTLGLTADLLPVVSKPTAKISGQSTMKQLGKTPSRYNGSGEVVGFAKWTEHQATPAEIKNWAGKPDYGICLQTRTVRAFDIDCGNPAVVGEIAAMIGHDLPTRFRTNSAKCLMVFALPGELPKRVIRMKEGIIELLGTGQQFIACGTHPSGVKYVWWRAPDHEELPTGIPVLTLAEVEAIWSALEAKFAVAPSSSATAPSKAKVLHAAIENDSVAQFLMDSGSVLSVDRDGKMHITCPFEDGHSTESAISSTTYFPKNTGGYAMGHFHCMHASCEHRTDGDFRDALEVPYENPLDDFDDLTLTLGHQAGVESNLATPSQANEIKGSKLELEGEKTTPLAKPRFTVVPALEFSQVQSAPWIVKHVLPQAEVGVIYGESTAGKSFFVLDLVAAVARGEPWRGHKVVKGNVVYIVAEGAGGMRSRLAAYGMHNDVALADLPIGIIADAPNFMEVTDVKEVLKAITVFGKVSVIVVDTVAQVMAGANENSGEDVGKMLKHCKALHKKTGALVLLIHHAGKDTSKGARGWSGLKAAADVEIEVLRDGDDRVACITKLKDGVDGIDFGFKLTVVELGVDEDLEAITSCALEYTDAKRPIMPAKKGRGGHNDPPVENLILRVVGNLVDVGMDTVSLHEVMAAVMSEMPFDPLSGRKDPRGKQLSVALDALRDSGRLVVVGGDKLKLPVVEIADEDLV
jgi:hypothetical protein